MWLFLKNFSLGLIAVIALNACKQKANNSGNSPRADSTQVVQKNPYSSLDLSPMDMIYYPANYPLLKMTNTDSLPLIARVIYSRPHKKGREIFSNNPKSLCPYGKAWRLGANEATEIEFFTNVFIAGKNIPRGEYVLYCIPYSDHWTIVFNTQLLSCGLYFEEAKDIFRTEIPVTVQNPPIEDFTMLFKQAGYGVDLLMAWDSVKAVLPIKFSIP